MLRAATLALAAVAAVASTGCTTTRYGPGPVEVTRYHLGTPVGRGTVSIEPMSTISDVSPQYIAYSQAVGTELDQLGFTPAPSGSDSEYIAAVSFLRAEAGVLRERPPVSIGIGGGNYPRSGVGVGGGLNLGLGGREREVIVSELWVQLRRRSDGTVIWEGRAQTRSVESDSPTPPEVGAGRLADALFKGFPGESGITITVP